MRSIRTKVSTAIISIVLLVVAIISFLSNYLINKQFTEYITRQQELRAQIITASISEQYITQKNQWDIEYIHTIGMLSLYEGYILKVYDREGRSLWDAQSHDMALCNRIMEEISERMRINYPQLEGEFQSEAYPLTQNGLRIGSVSISYFGPFFLSENEFKFLDSLNKVLIGVGLASLILSILIGHILARRISSPVLKTVEVTKKIAEGNYNVRLEEKADTRELNMLVGSINHLAYSLETLEKLRKQLTGDVAHELRTPITILQSHMEAMIEGVWEPTQERLEGCYEETVRISKLVDDLEQLAKVENRNIKLNKSIFSIQELMRKTADSFENELYKKNLKLALRGPEVNLYGDPDRMQQVLINLMSNAVKYTGNGGNISFTAFETGDAAGFSITDDGIGIPKEEQPFIFERFYRADKSRNRSSGGSGIGLTIVKSIVEAHDGRVKVISQPNEGSTFTVILPKNR